MDSPPRHLDDDAKEESPAAVTDAASGQTCRLAAGVVVALTTVTLVTVLLLSLVLFGFGTAPKVDQASTTSAMEQLQQCHRERHDLTLMLHAVTQDSRCTLCPEGWLWWRHHCYFFSVGREDNRQWSGSAEFCQQHNSSLAVIKDAAEMEFIQGVMRTFPKFPFLWVGLTDSRQEGQWLWWDGTDIQRYMPVTVEWDADHRDCADLRGGGSLFAADCEEYGPWACKRES